MSKNIDVRRKDNIPLQNRLVKLIGSKPVFECLLGGKKSEVLLDTGSMIALGDNNWVTSNFPDIEIRPISDFVDKQDEARIKFTAANNTEVEMLGCVELPFSIGDSTFPVPFLITNSELARPIIGYNVIEHFIKTGKPEDVVDLLINSVHDVEAEKVKVMVNLINESVEDDDFLGDLRAVKPCVIPAKSSARVRCRVKGDVKGLDLQFLCSEPCVADWDDDLVVSESLGELCRGRTPHVNIEIRNTSATDKYIRKNMIVGEISAINAVIPLKLFNSDPFEGDDVKQAEVLNLEGSADEAAKETPAPPKWQPKAKLDHLPEDQRK